MAQLSLFESTESVLAEGGSGRIAYTPHFVAAGVAQAWFEGIRAAVEWKAERRRMYDRDVEVPRLTAHFRLAGAGAEAAAPPAAILEAAEQVIAGTGVPFDSVGLNSGAIGEIRVSPTEHLYEIVEGFPIALLSLGATRRMTIRAKAPPRRALHVDLEAGSLLMMSYATQLHYTHGVPKTAEAVGERISLAFRVRPAPGASGGGGAGFYR